VRLSAAAIMTTLLALVFMPGCGSSSSYTDSPSYSVNALKNAVAAYNSSTPRDAAATGRACSSAYHSIAGNAPPKPPSSLATKMAKEADAIMLAYRYALLGFSDCATGASRRDYSLLAQADSELVRANVEISRARRLA
jgi:hypothetical protein